MKKWLIILMLTIITIPIVTAICCEKNKECIISETCQDGDCGDCDIAIYNRDGTTNLSHSNMTMVTSLTYIFNASRNLSTYGMYPYSINCSTQRVCQGECYVEIKQECEEQEGMTTGIILFLLTLNVGIFLTPFFVKQFSKNEVTNYIVKRMLWMTGIIILWFNTLIFRTLAKTFELGIDEFLNAYWWFFTLTMFIVIFSSMYFMVIGAIQLAKQAQMRHRMGQEMGQDGKERL